VSHPRIAAFARLANGNAEPLQAIEGQATGLGRTMHGVVYDEVHDEIVVTNPFAESILFFSANASGEEPPLRVIQGSKTYLNRPDTLAVDPVHNEVFVPLRNLGAVLVFPRDGNGNIAPLRILYGPKTQLKPNRLAVDPVNDLLVVGNIDPPALMVFNRTDQGDVPPKTIITGPKADIGAVQAVRVYPPRKQIIAAITDSRVFQTGGGGQIPFIGVWNYTDHGDVAPKAIIQGPDSGLKRPRGVALNAEKKEIYVVDMRRNALLTFSWPEIF